MRDDSAGFFWEDLPTARGKVTYDRPTPPIPDTGWVAPKEFPNLRNVKLLSLDTETRDPSLVEKGPGFRREGEDHAHIVGIAVGTEDGGRWYFPMRHTIAPEQNMDPEHVLAWARDNLCTPGQTKVGANIGYDVDALWSEGVPVTGPFVDVQYAEALLDENRRTYNLDILSHDYLGEGKAADELRSWIIRAYGDESNYRAHIWRAPPCLVGKYGEGDVDRPLRIYAQQRIRLQELGLTELFELETALTPQLIRMRQRGVRVDTEYAKRLDDDLSQGLIEIDARLEALAGRRIDVNVKDDLVRLFKSAGVEYPRTAPTKAYPTGQPSFVKEWLEHCPHPAAKLIAERRRLEKYQTTFVRGYVLDLHVNNRLHALFHPLRGDANGTVSGRFSSSLPNLQNIPVRDVVWGPKLRALFLPDDGEDWCRHDWSQIEYRFLAHYARGPSGASVRERYCSDPTTNFHKLTQSLIHDVTGVALDHKATKNINFGLCYGMGKTKLINDLGVSPSVGDELFAAYHKGVPFVKATYDAASARASQIGHIRTVLGRYARFELWEPVYGEGPALRESAARERYGRVRRAFTHKTLNRLLQGSAADLMKKAMVDLDKAGVERVLGPMLLTCHDETGHSKPRTKEAQEACDLVKHTMENCLKLRVPVIAEQSVGANWGECK